MKSSPIINYLMVVVFMLLTHLNLFAQIGEPPPPPPPPPNVEEVELFKVVEQMPRFPGCEMLRASEEVVIKCARDKMFEFIGKNLVYPQTAKDAKVEGTTVVNFVVGKKGKLRNIKVVRDIDGHFADAVTELIQKMPAWIPGKQRGKVVDVQMTLPVKFKLDSNVYGKGKSKKTDNGEIGMKGKSGKMKKGQKLGKVSPFDKKKKLQKGKVLKSNAQVPPPPPPPPPAPIVEEEETYMTVEHMPRFPGCENLDGKADEKKKCSDELMLQYIYKNIKYPSIARENGVEGTAVITFVVEKDGSISEGKIVRDPGAGIGEESLRVIESMNNMTEKWTPGVQRGRKARVLYTIPVKFKLENNNKSSKKKWWQFWK